MAEKRTTPEVRGGGRRKRAAPTIDLKATEVPTAAETPAEAETAARSPEQETAAPTPPPDEAQLATEPAAAPRPRRTRRDEESTTETASPQAAEKEGTAPPPPPPPPPRRGGIGGGITGGIIGAIIVAAAIGGLWYGGYIPPQSGNDQTDALRTRVAALQRQVQDLQNRPAPPAPDTSAVDQSVAALAQRIETMEQSIANLPTGDTSIADRVAAADDAVKSLGSALTALNRRSDDIAAKATRAQEQAAAAENAINDLRASVQNVSRQASNAVAPGQFDDVQQRIAALEQSVKSVRADLDQTTNALAERITRASAADRAARLALSASVLQTVVESGASYATELAQAKSLGADQKALAPLDPFAKSGVPDKSVLARQLLDIIPAMSKAAGSDEGDGTFLDRLQASASKLVQVRPVEAPAGDAPADVLARIESKAMREDIAGALAELARLPPPVRAPAQAWIARVKARQDALAAAQRFAADAARALGNG